MTSWTAPVPVSTSEPSGCSSSRVAGPADPADPAGGHAGDERVRRHVLVTTAPAATVAQAPMRTGATQTARAPIEAPSPMVTPTGSQSGADLSEPSGLTARG